MSLKNHIEATIKQQLQPEYLEVEDFSQLHADHHEVGDEGSHFAVKVVAAAFQGKSRLERERRISSLFAAEIASGRIHALTVKAASPAEAAEKKK